MSHVYLTYDIAPPVTGTPTEDTEKKVSDRTKTHSTTHGRPITSTSTTTITGSRQDWRATDT